MYKTPKHQGENEKRAEECVMNDRITCSRGGGGGAPWQRLQSFTSPTFTLISWIIFRTLSVEDGVRFLKMIHRGCDLEQQKKKHHKKAQQTHLSCNVLSCTDTNNNISPLPLNHSWGAAATVGFKPSILWFQAQSVLWPWSHETTSLPAPVKL